jgi:hypothetical protein
MRERGRGFELCEDLRNVRGCRAELPENALGEAPAGSQGSQGSPGFPSELRGSSAVVARCPMFSLRLA